MLGLAGCTAHIGDSSSDGPLAADASLDAPPPNLKQRGIVQVAQTPAGGGPAAITAGFYRVPVSAQGCQWQFAGDCSLATCTAQAGAVAVSAGNVAVQFGTGMTTLSYDAGTHSYPGTSFANVIPAGTPGVLGVAGGDVPNFVSMPLAMPAALVVRSPSDGGTISRATDLALVWDPAPGDAYVYIRQSDANTGAYPDDGSRIIRCSVSAAGGGTMVPRELVSQLAPGAHATNVFVSGANQQLFSIGGFDVFVRVLAFDAYRQVSVE